MPVSVIDSTSVLVQVPMARKQTIKDIMEIVYNFCDSNGSGYSISSQLKGRYSELNVGVANEEAAKELADLVREYLHPRYIVAYTYSSDFDGGTLFLELRGTSQTAIVLWLASLNAIVTALEESKNTIAGICGEMEIPLLPAGSISAPVTMVSAVRFEESDENSELEWHPVSAISLEDAQNFLAAYSKGA